MNKISIYALGLLAGVSLVACDNYKEPNPPAQSNKPVHVLQTSEVSVTNLLVAESIYDLQTMYDEGKNIAVASIICEVLPEGYDFGGYAIISTDDFENVYQVPIYGEDLGSGVYQLYMTPSDLENVYYDKISPRPYEATLGVKYYLETVYGDQYAIVGGPDNVYGPYEFTILPFDVKSEYLYTPGAANDWNFGKAQKLVTSDYITYWGYAVLSEEGFKITSLPAWNGINYGEGEEEGVLSDDDEAGNLTVEETGLYLLSVDLGTLEYSYVMIHEYSIVGSATPGGWDEDSELESEDYLVWSAPVYLVPGEFKFRANDNWDINLGGTDANLVPNGDNLTFDGEEGNYIVTLDFSNVPYTCTIKAQEETPETPDAPAE